MTIQERLARYINRISFSIFPPEVVRDAKKLLLDYLGVTLAGKNAEGCTSIVELAREMGSEGTCTVIGHSFKSQPNLAALANSVMGHAWDFDDTHDTAVLHTSVCIIPAALAIAERVNSSGEDLLTSIILGVDVHSRLGLGCKAGPFDNGWVYASMLGIFGAISAASKLLGLSESQTSNAIGIGYSMAAGNAQALVDGALTKRMQPGFSVSNGIISTLLAQKGVTGASNTFEGKYGLFNVYLNGKVDGDKIFDGIGERFEISNLSFKPYPACRFAHSAIDCAKRMRQKVGDSSYIKKISIYVTQQAYNTVCNPIEIKRSPRNIVDAQFSAPYLVSCTLLYGDVSLSDITTEAIKRVDVLNTAEKVEAIVDEEFTRRFGRGISPARIEIELENGTRIEEEVLFPKGHPKEPISFDEIKAKFTKCAQFADINQEVIERITELAESIEKHENLREFLELLTEAEARPIQFTCCEEEE